MKQIYWDEIRKPDPLGAFQPYVDDWWGNVDSRTKYMLRTMASGLPVIGSLYQAHDNMRYMDDYIRNRGLDYGDILYPSRTAGAQGYGSAVSFVSSNITRLYKEEKYAKRRRASNSRRRRSRTYF